MRKVGANSYALGALAVVSVATASGSGCSTKKPTELVPAVMSQVVVPHDLQSVRITVFSNGKTQFDVAYDVGPNGTVELPSTLGVVSGEAPSTVVRITVRGYETACAASDDCNQQDDNPVGSSGSRILRRSVQTFVDQHTLFVPLPLSYSCWNKDCGIATNMSCKANTCSDGTTSTLALVDFDPSLVDGTGVCFSPKQCFGDKPDGGTSLAIAPLLVDADTCTYAFPGPAPLGLNVRAYYQNFAWMKNGSGQFQPMLKSGGEQEILNEDPVEGFTLLDGADGGVADSGVKGTLFRLGPGLCELAKRASNPPPTPDAPDAGAPTYITISDLRVAALCPPKTPLLPICKGEQTNGPAVPSGAAINTQDLTCNIGVPVAPTASALYLVMDQSASMHGAFGPMGAATTLSLSLNDPVFKRTSAAFTFLPSPVNGQSQDCTNVMTPLTTPEIDFDLAANVQQKIAAKLFGWTAPDTMGGPFNPLDLQGAMRLDAGAYKHVLDFLVGKEAPNIAAAMFFVNRTPDTTNDCNPPLAGQTTVQAALESEILAAFNATPSLQTYFVVLDNDQHDKTPLTFFQKIQSDLPQAVQVLDATSTGSQMAAQTAAANFSKLVTQLGTCLYDYALPVGMDPTKVEVAFAVPGQSQPRVVPSSANCSAANQTTVDGWNIDGGRLRICGSSCTDLRNAILAAAGAALQTGQPAPDVPVTATILCSGSAPVNDAGPTEDAGGSAQGSSSGGDASFGGGSSGGGGDGGASSGGTPIGTRDASTDATVLGDDGGGNFPDGSLSAEAGVAPH
jgi:hypothetical protein